MEIVKRKRVFVTVFLCCVTVACSVTDPNDLKILNDFKKGLDNPELLNWPENGDDPCVSPPWPHVFCSGNRVTQIQVKNLGLRGPLPQNFNQLSKLSNVGLQWNNFTGNLPSFSGLSELEFAYLDSNKFDTIPSDFFDGLNNVRALALDHNPFNASTGWSLPDSLANSVQLVNLSCVGCNLIGPLPDFLGSLPSLTALRLSYNGFSGDIPASFGQSAMQILWLNNQQDSGMNGTIDVIAKMVALTQLWLHGNRFTGKIPANIGNLTALKELKLNDNQFVGMVPESLANMELQNLTLDDNKLMGPIPKFKAGKVSYAHNSFCQSKPGIQCAPEVSILLDFLDGLNFPLDLASQWSGNDPCQGPWLGLSCNLESKVFVINLPRHNLTGTIRPSIAKLDSLMDIRLAENNINGTVPMNLTELPSLRLMNLSQNNIAPPLPKFRNDVNLVTEGNPLLTTSNWSQISPSPLSIPPLENPHGHPPIVHSRPSPTTGSHLEPSASVQEPSQAKNLKKYMKIIVAGVAVLAVMVLVAIFLCVCCFKKRNNASKAPSSIVVHPRDQSDPGNNVKIVIANPDGSLSTQTASSSGSCNSGATEGSHVIDAENLVINVQVLRKVTKNFSPENELGRGGFGSVYRGELEDGTKIAVKRMGTGVMNSKVLDEFQAEIAVLSKVRHRHLVSLLGFSIEGSERLLIYEYMPQGALSRHLFHWKSLKLEPLSWARRLTIALDVARGMEYLHSLARQTFIHRDLKSSNILLDDDFRAKVSDFGLVKLAPDGEKSVVTRLAGTFGYLAPEYAVMGKITTKADVFSYGVVLMELLTGLVALDEERSEESRYLAEWFSRIKSNKEKLTAAIDLALDVNEETLESISIISELAGHCTAREPHNRPDMGYVVNVLAPLVVNWKPVNDESDYCLGVDYSQPLPQMLKIWQEAESREASYSNSEDSRGSLPARPAGFADSFTSADAR